jgi:hypothetical protein
MTTYVPVVASHEQKSSNSQLYDTCTASHGYLTMRVLVLNVLNAPNSTVAKRTILKETSNKFYYFLVFESINS